MLRPHPVDLRGVLRTPRDQDWELRRWEPGDALRPYVAWHWAVRWSLPDGATHDQAVLPHPSAHLAVEDGRAEVHGPRRRRFERRLHGSGLVVAVRFRPGGLRPLLGAAVASTADRTLPAEVLGLDGPALVRAVERAPDLDAAVLALETALRPLLPAEPDPAVALADRAVALLAQDPSLTRVPQLAARLGLSTRTLQRLFSEHVGLGAAVVVRRQRLHEVAARALAGDAVDWARVADELGYCDQAHLVRDFTAAVGTPPARYAAAR